MEIWFMSIAIKEWIRLNKTSAWWTHTHSGKIPEISTPNLIFGIGIGILGQIPSFIVQSV